MEKVSITPQMKELHALSRSQKIKLAQMLWDDVAAEQDDGKLSPEHKAILDERMERMQAGATRFKPWEEVLQQFQK